MDHRLISTILAIALVIALFRTREHEKTRVGIHDMLTFVWLLYGLHYKDYYVISICLVILLVGLP